MKLAIFEDEKSTDFYPLTYLHPVYDLRCGILTLKEKIEKAYGQSAEILYCREYLSASLQEKNVNSEINPRELSNTLLINGRVFVHSEFIKQIQLEGEDELFIANNQIIAARIIKSKNIKNDLNISSNLFSEFKVTNVDVETVNYPWDLISKNGNEIAKDSVYIDKNIHGNIYEGVHLINQHEIAIGEKSNIKSGVVLDAENGPIIIGDNVTIFPNAVIEGPCFVGDNSKIKIGAKIYENTSIGEHCKIGGEVEESIIHSYSNKQHDGFLGHSYLGQWVNLGADTNNSDLKNNYGSVKVTINGKEIDSGSQFVGLIMGDHSKCGINTMFNTGTVVGISSNIFGGDFPPKVIPSFSWGGSAGFVEYKLQKAIEVAETVTARRNVTFTQIDKELFKYVFSLLTANLLY